MNESVSFSIVVPCFNEQDALTSTVSGLDRLTVGDADYEIIVVDDGSTDDSARILGELSTRYPRLRVFSHDRNRGYGAALKSGIRRARHDIVVITDADGTYPVTAIPALLNAIDDADMVVGARTGRNVVYSRLRRLPKVFLRRYASWLVGEDIPDINSGLRVFRKAVIERFVHMLPDTFSFTTTITIAMLSNQLPVIFIPIDYAARVGQSKIHPIKDTLRFAQLIVRTGIYFAPLKVFSPVIAVLTLAFVASLCYDILVARNLTDKTVIFLLFSMNTTIFALLADMIDKRTMR